MISTTFDLMTGPEGARLLGVRPALARNKARRAAGQMLGWPIKLGRDWVAPRSVWEELLRLPPRSKGGRPRHKLVEV